MFILKRCSPKALQAGSMFSSHAVMLLKHTSADLECPEALGDPEGQQAVPMTAPPA